MKKYLFFIILGFICPAVCLIRSISYDQRCGVYLEQARKAASPELALERLEIAIQYIETHDLKEGYISWKDERANVNFWYRNIKACQQELKSCLKGSTLERSNTLMRVHEALTDTPNGISLHPYSGWFFVGNILSGILICIGIGGIIFNVNRIED